ncbi:Chromatin assembly factor 1 subunit B [Balamuthia mandrillaris]
MKAAPLLIAWHQREPVFSVDVDSRSGRLATGGADRNVNVWKVVDGCSSTVGAAANGNAVKTHVPTPSLPPVHVEFRAHLSRHDKPVNVVRFSPDGALLASGSDDGTIVLWRLVSEEPPPKDFGEEAETVSKETWGIVRMLRGHADVYDIAWSPCSRYLLSGSTDNSVAVWDVTTGKMKQKLEDHGHYVQGVAWDPQHQYLATQSSDRSVRLYKQPGSTSTKPKKGFSSFICRNVVTSREIDEQHKHRIYLNETVSSFFRRLAWTVDGSLLLTPTAQFQATADSPLVNTVYAFARNSLKTPVMHYPCSEPAIAVRCNPKLFALEKSPTSSCYPGSLLKLDYRMIFAVATLRRVLIYDTQHTYPLCMVADLHYAPLTDLCWTADGTRLFVSSADGYCSVVSFEAGELGTEYHQ